MSTRYDIMGHKMLEAWALVFTPDFYLKVWHLILQLQILSICPEIITLIV